MNIGSVGPLRRFFFSSSSRFKLCFFNFDRLKRRTSGDAAKPSERAARARAARNNSRESIFSFLSRESQLLNCQRNIIIFSLRNVCLCVCISCVCVCDSPGYVGIFFVFEALSYDPIRPNVCVCFVFLLLKIKVVPRSREQLVSVYLCVCVCVV